MKFFSNEAKENTDRPGYDEDRDRAESDTTTVPQQRAGSPWSDAPGAAEDEIAAREGRTGTAELPDQTQAADVGDQGTRPATERDQPDEAEPASTTTYGPDGAVIDEPAGDRTGDTTETAAVKDEGTFDSPTVAEPATGEPLDTTAKTDDEPADEGVTAKSDEGTNDEAAVDQRSRADEVAVATAAVPVAAGAVPVDAGQRTTPDDDTATDADTVPVVAAAAVPATPAPAADRFFPDGDTFAERFRDIQLRFVDSPKDSTTEAAALVSEALDKLAEALKAQQNAVASDSDDTEKLRVELRGYRDLLNRVVTL